MPASSESRSTDSSTSRSANTSPRLERYTARTQRALDLFALLTLWIVLVPPWAYSRHGVSVVSLVARIAISVVYGVDMAIRCHLAPKGMQYARQHPVGLCSVLLPPIRVVFSLRLIQSLFKRGSLGRFLLAAFVLFLNGAIIVYYVERHASGANITSFRDSLWWSVVTVTTVGYGDLYPVTGYGQSIAAFIMVLGLLTLAVVTAQVSSSFNEQARQRRASAMQSGLGGGEVPVAELRELRDQINQLLGESIPGPTITPGGGPGQGSDRSDGSV